MLPLIWAFLSRVSDGFIWKVFCEKCYQIQLDVCGGQLKLTGGIASWLHGFMDGHRGLTKKGSTEFLH